jgi:type II secretory pathway pseudopilin PulG
MTPLTPEQQAALEQLRDIRLPEPIGWWPLAPGWWALAALVLLLAAAALAWSILRRRTRRFAALAELQALRARLEASEDAGRDTGEGRGESTGADASVAADLAALVRRVALSAQGRHLARLSDRNWAEALAAGRTGLPPEIASLLAEAPYRRPETLDPARVKRLLGPTETWIRRVA